MAEATAIGKEIIPNENMISRKEKIYVEVHQAARVG